MAHAKDDHNKAEAYHHMSGKEKRAHEGSQSPPPGKKSGNGFPSNPDEAAY